MTAETWPLDENGDCAGMPGSRQWQLTTLAEKMNAFARTDIYSLALDAKIYLLRNVVREGDLKRIVPEDLAPWLSDERDWVRDFGLELVRAMPMSRFIAEGWHSLSEGEFWQFAEWCDTMGYRLDGFDHWPFTQRHLHHALATVFVATQFQPRTKAWIRRVRPELYAAALTTTDGELRAKLISLTPEMGADLPPESE